MDSYAAYRFRVLDRRQRILDVSGTSWEHEDLEALSGIAQYMDIKDLRLRNCGLDKTKVPSLLNVVRNAPGLEVLDLRDNDFGPGDAWFFQEIAEICPMLASIDMGGNDMKKVVWTERVEMLV